LKVKYKDHKTLDKHLTRKI